MPSWPAKIRIFMKRLVMCCRVSLMMDTEFLMSRIQDTSIVPRAKTAVYVNQFLHDFFNI